MEEEYCRICMESSQPLIHPCKCSGSLKFVHESCLKTWLSSKSKDIEIWQCEICHTDYLMNLVSSAKCSPSKLCNDKLGHCLFIPLILLVFCLLSFVIALTAKILIDGGDSYRSKALGLMITCCICFIAFIPLFISALRKACFVKEIREWRILSQDFKSPETNCLISTTEQQTKNKVVRVHSKSIIVNSRSFNLLQSAFSGSPRYNRRISDISNISL